MRSATDSTAGNRIEFIPRHPATLTAHPQAHPGPNRQMDILQLLYRIHQILLNHSGDAASWIQSAIDTGRRNEEELLRLLSSVRMWGGAGSVANEALADNPGMDELLWQAETRELRQLMIDMGNELQRRGHAHPDMQSWLLAFSNWNQSGL
jgi:hypothetical protein